MNAVPRRIALVAAFAAATLVVAGCSSAGGGEGDETNPPYPTGRVTLLSGFEAGGGIDLAINTTIQALEDNDLVDVPMSIDHLPGGSGLIAAASLGTAPEGTDDLLQLTSISSLTASIQNPGDFQITDLTPVALLYQEYSTMYVRADSDFETVQDVADALEDDPTSLVFAGGTLGSPSNLSIAQFTTAAGVPFDQVSYLPLSGSETELALLGSTADVISGGLETMSFVESGDFRALAISSAERLDAAEDIPTYTEEGFDVVQGSWRGVFAPPTMPDYAVEFWKDAFEKAVATDTFTDAADQYGWQVTYLAGDDFADFLTEQSDSLTTLLGEIGLI